MHHQRRILQLLEELVHRAMVGTFAFVLLVISGVGCVLFVSSTSALSTSTWEKLLHALGGQSLFAMLGVATLGLTWSVARPAWSERAMAMLHDKAVLAGLVLAALILAVWSVA